MIHFYTMLSVKDCPMGKGSYAKMSYLVCRLRLSQVTGFGYKKIVQVGQKLSLEHFKGFVA